ncbi:MAG: FKBP-type peptidyl-prolyl cis-trans isomerase N-terminal domain-containing protein [Flavobacteriales bacterium]|jgi:FKBP-type peptidyl-prolyl cis-trans isomerase FklB|tara:strand:- start:1628 stop:2350 length:723 start_codon:yes stop_codon:yes gene_type:complete
MKTPQIIVICLVILSSSCTEEPKYKTPKTDIERFSYSIGVNVATSMKDKHDLKEIDALSIAKGFDDVIYDKKLDIELLGTDSILNEYFDKLSQAIKFEQAAQALKEGEEYMIENAKKEGVLTTNSGLQYEVLKSGIKGTKIQENNVVTFHYQASLINGEVFANSIGKEPSQMPTVISQSTITGLYEALLLMSVGDQYEFTIPAKLAYRNESPKGSPIPHGSTLIFVIEVISLTTIEGTQL